MAKNSITDYDNIAANNTDIQSVDIDEGCAPSGINNAIRELMADLADVNDGTVPLASPDINGGTIDGVTIGGTTAGAGTFTTFTSTGIDDNAASTAVTLDGSGNVGIGTSSPSALLGVNGRVTLGNQATSGTAGAGGMIVGAGAFYIQSSENQNSSNKAPIVFSNIGGSSESMRIDSSGNVGIGTSSPSYPLHVNGRISYAGAIGEGADITLSSVSTTIIHAASATWTAQAFYTGGTERMRIDSSGNVGIGTSSPSCELTVSSGASSAAVHGYTQLEIESASHSALQFSGSTGAEQWIWFADDASGTPVGGITYYHGGPYMGFRVEGSERMRIDSSGRMLIGHTTAKGYALDVDKANLGAASFNRTGTDGEIVSLRKDGTTVGVIGTWGGGFYVGSPVGATAYLYFANSYVAPSTASGFRDNAIDLGNGSARFDDIYATNGTIQTSDANEKQQIASLTDAEMTAAKAISKLFKTFKWNDKVEAKGDAARRHAGVIAQDVQQAMTDAGLDAGDYAFFISTTWWETQTEVPAVEADEEKGIEAQDAYTRTDTYDTAEEAPEGATERTRLGIRYPELLSFIGAATEQRLASIESRLDTLENA